MTTAQLLAQSALEQILLTSSTAPWRGRSSEVAPFRRSAIGRRELVMPAMPVPVPRAFASLPHVAGLRLDGLEVAGVVRASAFTAGIPASLAAAAPKRIASFLAGRCCASTALRAAGAADVDVARADDGAPRWPAGFVGSITHTTTRAFAAVARDTELRSIGIDCEVLLDAVAARELGATICPELDAIAPRTAGDPLPDGPTLVSLAFSVKESVYKCLNPLVHAFFEFDAVTILWVDWRDGRVGMRLDRTLGADFVEGIEFAGTFSTEDGHVFTAVTVGDARCRAAS